MSGSSYAHLADIFKPKDKKSRRGMPVRGIFTVTEWAEEFELTEQQFRNWINEYRIPYFKGGRRMYVRAKDVWSRLPYFTHELPAESEQLE